MFLCSLAIIDIIFFFLFRHRDLELFAYLVNHKASVFPPAVSLALSQSFSSSRRRVSVFCKVLLYQIKNLNSALWSSPFLAIQWKKSWRLGTHNPLSTAAIFNSSPLSSIPGPPPRARSISSKSRYISLLHNLNLSHIVGGKNGYSANGHFPECKPNTVEQCKTSFDVRSLTLLFSCANSEILRPLGKFWNDAARRSSSFALSPWICRGIRQLMGTTPEMNGSTNGENSPKAMKTRPKMGIRRESWRLRL